MPDAFWKRHNAAIEETKRRFGLEHIEIHTGWILRPYVEQLAISDFESLSPEKRRSEVVKRRTAQLLSLQRAGGRRYKQAKKTFTKTEPYIHLTFEERRQFVHRVAEVIGKWGEARLFAECIDKLHFDPRLAGVKVEEQAFEQIVSRFEQSLRNRRGEYGILIHDNNETVARKHTDLMKAFLKSGTLWTELEHVIETPMFVDSQLTSMVQGQTWLLTR